MASASPASTRARSGREAARSAITFASAFTAGVQHDVKGHQAFLPDTLAGSLRIVDLSSSSDPHSVGIYGMNNTTTHALAFGNYAAVGLSNQLRFYELATPRALTNEASIPGAGFHPSVQGGFLYTSGSAVFDLQAGSNPVSANASPATPCTLGATYDEDLEIRARGDGFEVRNLEVVTDRNALTSGVPAYSVLLMGGTRVTDVELWGNYLVVAEVRSFGTTGVYLEVFDIREAKNRGGVSVSSADSVGSILVAAIATPPTSLVADLSIHAGRAAVGLDTNAGSPVTPATGNNLYFVELKGFFDDDNTTTGGPVHGPVSTVQVRQVVMQGDYAYAATTLGVRLFRIAEVMDSNPATLLPSSPTQSAVLMSGTGGNPVDGIFVSGSLVLATPAMSPNGFTPQYSQGVYAIDVSGYRRSPRCSASTRATGLPMCAPRPETLPSVACRRGSPPWATGRI